MIQTHSSIALSPSLKVAIDIFHRVQALLPDEETTMLQLGVMSNGVEQCLVLKKVSQEPVHIVFGLQGPWQDEIIVRYGCAYQFHSRTNLPIRGQAPAQKVFELYDIVGAARFICEFLAESEEALFHNGLE